MRHFAIFVAFFITSLFSYGSPDELLIPLQPFSATPLLPKASIPKQELLQDIETLISAIEKGYAGSDIFSQQLKNEIFPALKNLKQESYSTQEFCDHVGKALDAIADNHIMTLYFKALASCQKTGLRKGQVGSNIKEHDNAPWAYFEKDINGHKVPVIAITQLPNPDYAGWAGFINKIAEIYRTAPSLVIDLRGNGGGDDRMPFQMARILYGMGGQKDFPQPSTKEIQKQSPEALALLSNLFGFQILLSRLKGIEPSSDLFKIYGEWKANYDISMKGNLAPDHIIQNSPIPVDPTRIFKGPIRLLVDAECASSCEGTVESFELHPNSKTVGENTAGMVHFGNMGKIWLRNSNLFITIPTKRYIYDDGRFVEKIGYTSKVPVEAGKDAMDAALKNIAETLGW